MAALAPLFDLIILHRIEHVATPSTSELLQVADIMEHEGMRQLALRDAQPGGEVRRGLIEVREIRSERMRAGRFVRAESRPPDIPPG
jgi:hypothetical protein